jgi:hypothetical protein
LNEKSRLERLFFMQKWLVTGVLIAQGAIEFVVIEGL